MKTVARWHKSIDELSEIEWNDIFHNEIIKSYAIFKAVEYSKMDTVCHYYLSISSDIKTVAIVPCFTYKLDLCVLMDKKTQHFVNKVRKIWSSFLFMDIFCAGSLIATCEQHFGITPHSTNDYYTEIKHHINTEIKKKVKETKSSIVFIKEVPANELEHVKNFLDDDFIFYYSLPNTFIPTSKEFHSYPQALSNRSRKRFHKFSNKFDELGIHWEIYNDFSHLTEVMFKLYYEVYNRSKNKFDRLNKLFFDNINKYLPETSYIALSKTSTGEITSIMLVIEEKTKLVPLYLGLNYTFDDYRTVYFNTLFKTISESEKKNKDILILGQTSYYPKIHTGFLMQDLYLGFYSHKIIYKLCIKYLFKYLFPRTNKPCNYKYTDIEKLKTWVKKNNLFVDLSKIND